MNNIHATCISYNKKGILIIGKSGSGKSDLALRMIMCKGAKLVSDDRTDISFKNKNIYAQPPQTIEGLLEVRGFGIKKLPFIKRQKINLAVELVDNLKKIERLPDADFYTIEGMKIPLIKLYPFELSSLEKLELACDEV
jgi:serine kinase of HPr protein (carbohydrate metabolism regulator)